MIWKRLIIALITMMLLLAPSFFPVSIVEGLDFPHYILGYVWNSTGGNVTNVVVTLTDLNNGNSMTTTTDTDGYYQADVSQITGSGDGDTIEVNVTYGGEAGDNSTQIDVSLGSQWCNVTTATTTLSISVTPSSWNQGTLYLNTVNSTTGNYFNLTNNGNIRINVLVQGENITWDGNTWYINNTADHDKFVFQYNKSSDTSWSTISYINSTFITDLNDDYYSGIPNQAAKNYITFDLKIILPTSSTDEPPQLSTNITFWAVEP